MQFLEKELKRAKQEYEELRQEHNSCCEEFKQEINLRIDAYNKLSRDFWSGKYCNAKFCTQLQAKEQECEELKEHLNQAKYLTEGALQLYSERQNIKYKQALDEIKKIAQQGLEPICYKSNCSRCECYDGDNCKASVTEFLNHFFDDNGDMRENEDFSESLIALVDEERLKCNRAKPISEKILDIINKAKESE